MNNKTENEVFRVVLKESVLSYIEDRKENKSHTQAACRSVILARNALRKLGIENEADILAVSNELCDELDKHRREYEMKVGIICCCGKLYKTCEGECKQLNAQELDVFSKLCKEKKVLDMSTRINFEGIPGKKTEIFRLMELEEPRLIREYGYRYIVTYKDKSKQPLRISNNPGAENIHQLVKILSTDKHPHVSFRHGATVFPNTEEGCRSAFEFHKECRAYDFSLH